MRYWSFTKEYNQKVEKSCCQITFNRQEKVKRERKQEVQTNLQKWLWATMGNHIFAQKNIHMIIWTKNLLKNYNAFSYYFLVCLFIFYLTGMGPNSTLKYTGTILKTSLNKIYPTKFSRYFLVLNFI